VSASTRELIKDSAEQFASNTRRHELTVVRDDGLHRHLRFRAPDSGFYWFDLVTWPGYLTFVGDWPAHVFARVPDMFEFFRGKSGWNRDTINPGYWAEKLQSDRNCAMRYSEHKFRSLVADDVDQYADEWPGLRDAVAAQILGDEAHWDIAFEDGAREALRDFEFRLNDRRVFAFEGAWEWDFADWDWAFLMACHAIQWGIAQYDARITGGTS